MLSKEEIDALRRYVNDRREFHFMTVAQLLVHIEGLQSKIDYLQENHTTQSLALKAATAMQQAETGRADAAEEETGRISDKLQFMWQDRDHWKANHENQVRRARILMERPDMPIERVKAYQHMIGLEKDAERYRYIRTKERMMLETEDGEARMTATFECAEQFDAAVDESMQFDADRASAAKIVSKVPSAAKKLDLDALAAIGDLPCGAACATIQPLSTKE